jgi:DNA (cytosine-5)-methyltransferase 1
MPRHDGPLRLTDWFCGAGGSTQGIATIPGVQPTHAANHWAKAIESHAANFPDVEHWKGDIRDIDVRKLPDSELFWSSPECTTWSRARGKGRDYANADIVLPGMEEPAPPEEVERSRALMEEVPLYLEAMVLRGRPVLAGVVENVVEIRDWTDWGRWRSQIEGLGYRTRLIALNSMHAQSVRTARAPQSRDRLYLAYWHKSLRRDPDWEKWLRPAAWCPTCEGWVSAVQVFKDPKRDMGRYRSQYVYRCPQVACRGQVVEPEFLPAYTAIDWSVWGERIGDRARPLAVKTVARIEAGIQKFARPITLEAAGHTFERRPGVRTWPADGPLTTLTSTATKAVAVPPLLVPVEGRDGKQPSTVHRPLRTQSTRAETALVTVPLLVPAGGTWNDTATPVTDAMRTRSTRENEALVVAPFISTLRGRSGSHPASDPLTAITASGAHHGLVVAPFIAEPRGGGSIARPVAEALATVTASGNRHGLVPSGMVMRNNGSRGSGGEHCTALDDAMRTLTTTGHQSLVTWGWDEWASLYAYDSGEVRSLLRELPTQTTVEGDALLYGAGLPAVEDCLFRMLEPHEIGAGMAFASDYVVLGNRRERVRQYGNAVTPPAAEVIVSALVECITGEDVAV